MTACQGCLSTVAAATSKETCRKWSSAGQTYPHFTAKGVSSKNSEIEYVRERELREVKVSVMRPRTI